MAKKRRAIAETCIFALASSVWLAGCSDENMPGDANDTRPFSEIAPDHTLKLTGTEPFWAGQIANETLIWSTPDQVDVEVPVVRFPGRGGISFSGEYDGATLDILVTPAPCSDGMSERTYPYFVAVRIGETTREGCAWREGVDAQITP